MYELPNVIIVSPLDPEKKNGAVPPVMVTSTAPSLLKQVLPVVVNEAIPIGGTLLTDVPLVAEQPVESVTVTV